MNLTSVALEPSFVSERTDFAANLFAGIQTCVLGYMASTPGSVLARR